MSRRSEMLSLLFGTLALAVVVSLPAPADAQATPGSCVARSDARPACPLDATFSAPGGCAYEPRDFWSRLFGYRSHCRLSDCGRCVTGEFIDEARGLCCGMPEPPSAAGVDFLLADRVSIGGSRPDGTVNWVHLVRGYRRDYRPPSFDRPEFSWTRFATYVNAQPTGTPAALREIRGVDYGPATGGGSGTWFYATGPSGRSDCIRAVNKRAGTAPYFATVRADPEGRIYSDFRGPSFDEINDLCPANVAKDLVVTPMFVYTSLSCGAGCDGQIFRLDRTTGVEELWLTVPVSEIGFWAGNFAFDAEGTLYLSSGNLAHGAKIYRVQRTASGVARLEEVYRRAEGSIMGFDFGPTGHLYFTERSTRIYELRDFSNESLFGDFYSPPARRLTDITFPD